MSIDVRSQQRALAAKGYYKGPIDGIFGKGSRAGRDALLKSINAKSVSWSESRKQLALQQWVMAQVEIEVGEIDGLMGPQTRHGLDDWMRHLRDRNLEDGAVSHIKSEFPRQRDMLDFYGKPGTNHTKLKLPYPMRIAWDKSQTIQAFTINKKCADSAAKAFAKVHDHYGYSEIRRLGLDLFGGCYNNRKMRGGSSLSTHAFAAAIDMHPEKNRFRWDSSKAVFARKEYAPFLDAFEEQGWVSLGREINRDWMHLQAARL